MTKMQHIKSTVFGFFFTILETNITQLDTGNLTKRQIEQIFNTPQTHQQVQSIATFCLPKTLLYSIKGVQCVNLQN